MKEIFDSERFFIKNKDDLEMLQKSLESEKIDQDIIPILEKFFSLPITPIESCYGHPKQVQSPYLAYINDNTENNRDKNFQRLFNEQIAELTKKINLKIGNEAVNIFIKEEVVDYKGEKKDYIMRFEIIDKKNFQENGKKILNIIWDEFSKYVDELK